MRARQGVAAAAAAAVLGAVLGIPAPAAAQAGSCKLTWHEPTRHVITLTYRCTPRSPGDVAINMDLYADDLFSDDLIATMCLKPSQTSVDVDGDWLNEDLGDRDEVYAEMLFRRPDGKRYIIRTNKIAGWWGRPGPSFPAPVNTGC